MYYSLRTLLIRTAAFVWEHFPEKKSMTGSSGGGHACHFGVKYDSTNYIRRRRPKYSFNL